MYIDGEETVSNLAALQSIITDINSLIDSLLEDNTLDVIFKKYMLSMLYNLRESCENYLFNGGTGVRDTVYASAGRIREILKEYENVESYKKYLANAKNVITNVATAVNIVQAGVFLFQIGT